MRRRGARALGAALFMAGAMAGCASRTASPPAAAPVRPAPAAASASFATLAEAEPALLALEDRRAFEAGTLAAGASSSAAPVRARTALALGRIGDERAAAPLRTLLSDRSPEVRESAAFAAGILGDPSLSAALVPGLSDVAPAVAARTAWAIGFLAAPGAEATLSATLSGASSVGLKAACLLALARFPTPSAAAAVRPYAADSDARVRAAALYALARRPQESSLPTLTAAISDPDPDAAAICARALGILGKKESIGVLAAALDDPRVAVKVFAAMALASALEKNPGTSLPLEKQSRVIALSSDANPNVAVPALRLLRWLVDDREAFRRLTATASGGEKRRQQVALQALMAGLGEKSDPFVEAAMSSANPFLRGAVAEALGDLPESDAAPRRARLASDPEVVVRLKVLEGLSTPDLVRSNRALVDGLRADANVAVQAGTIDALALLEEPATLPLFREAVVASYGMAAPDVPIEAISAAEKQSAQPEARAVVEAAYRHPATLVSRLARRSLVTVFHADPAAFPWREYTTGKSLGDYASLLAQAHRGWTGTIETDRGLFRIRLAGEAAPMTTMNFVRLTEQKFFDGAPIHRVVPGFVVQDGDPTGTGSGGPGYEIRDEVNVLPYTAGTVGMALSGPDTGGSQWFVTQAPEPHLDGIYTVFGQVEAGMDVVLRIEQGDRIRRVTVGGGS